MEQEKVIEKATDKGVHKKENVNAKLKEIEFGQWDKSREKFRELLTRKERIK